MPIKTIKKRSDFVYSHKNSLKLEGKFLKFQKLNRNDFSNEIYFGFTITKKVAIAVVRNRIKRRLKSIIRLLKKNKKNYFNNGHNYVLISKANINNASFYDLKDEITLSFEKLKSTD